MLKLTFKTLFYSISTIALLFCREPAYADNIASAEALWIDSKNKIQTIEFARLIHDEWQAESTIYETDNAMTSLALGTSESGEKIVVWTEQIRFKTVLMFMKGSVFKDSIRWSNASLLDDTGIENFSASIVYDMAGVAWVFWASTREDYSDIVLRKFDGSWSKVEQVHSPNKVPDISPRTSISQSGDVLVEWESYDFQENDYVSRLRKYVSVTSSDDQAKEILVDKVKPSDVQTPPSMYTGGFALLHFPTNQMTQSVLYNQRSLK